MATPFHAAPSARLRRVSAAAPLSQGSAGVSTAWLGLGLGLGLGLELGLELGLGLGLGLG